MGACAKVEGATTGALLPLPLACACAAPGSAVVRLHSPGDPSQSLLTASRYVSACRRQVAWGVRQLPARHCFCRVQPGSASFAVLGHFAAAGEGKETRPLQEHTRSRTHTKPWHHQAFSLRAQQPALKAAARERMKMIPMASWVRRGASSVSAAAADTAAAAATAATAAGTCSSESACRDLTAATDAFGAYTDNG